MFQEEWWMTNNQNFSQNKDFNDFFKSKLKEEKLRMKQQYLLIQQEQEYERHNSKMILLEYELQRVRKKGLKVFNERFLHHSKSKIRSESKISLILGQDLPNKAVPKCLECMQISSADIYRIRFDIHRNAALKTILHNKLQKDINGPDNVLLGRKSGEGLKSIYKNDDIKKSLNQRGSPRFQSYDYSRNRAKNKTDECGVSYTKRRRYSPLQKEDRFNHFHLRSSKDAMHFREYRGRSRDRFRERRVRFRGWRDSLPTLFKYVPVPVPVYYGNFSENQKTIEPRVARSSWQTPNVYRSGKHLILTKSNNCIIRLAILSIVDTYIDRGSYFT